MAKCQRSVAGVFFPPLPLPPSYFFVAFAPQAFATQATTVCATYLLCLLLKSYDDLYKMVMLKKKRLTRLPTNFSFQVTSWTAFRSCVAPPGKCSANSGIKSRTRTVSSYPSCGGKGCPSLVDTSQCTPVPIQCKVFLILLSIFDCSLRSKLMTTLVDKNKNTTFGTLISNGTSLLRGHLST